MYRTKKDVDKHVENLITKLSVKEFKTRAYSVARLYFEVGDYASCQRYVEQYLTQKDNNAAAHKLLGQALHKLGQKERAIEHYKTSLDIDPTQTSTILDICELLADDEVVIDPGRAKYWCEKAEATFPRHPVTFCLRERLVTISNPDPQALVKLLTAELSLRPKDALLHLRLLKNYLHTSQIKEAFEHSINVEFSGNTFINNFSWYDTLAEIVKHNVLNTNDWLYQLLLLTVRERICVLSLTETPSGLSKSLVESNELLHAYDLAIDSVARAGASPGFGEFHSNLLHHHKGQFAFHAATFLLKKAKKDQLSWRDASQFAAPLMLIAWQTVPLDSKVNWLSHSPDKQQFAVHRWHIDGTYRCSQAGHYLLSNVHDKSQSFLDRISQCCSGTHWRDKLYEKLFTSRDHLNKIKSSHFVSDAYPNPILRLPRRVEVEAYDSDAQRQYPNSLHHFVWTLTNYKNYAYFKCTLFDMLKPTATNCGPESLNKMDVCAFLYCATFTSQQHKLNGMYLASDKPNVLPASITDLQCTLPQMKWWDCAYKFSQNVLGTELTDIRATLSRGIEIVRCIDNHGLDPELLCLLGNIFREQAKLTTVVEEKNNLEIRAGLYYSNALPLLEKFKSKITIKMPSKRMFDYTHKELGTKELNYLIEECKLYVAVNYLNECEYEKVIDLLSGLKSPEAYYHLSHTYNRIALEDRNITKDSNSTEIKSKYALLAKAKNLAYKALEKVKETETNKNHPLYADIQQLIEDIEIGSNKLQPDFSSTVMNDVDGKYSSDENISSVSDHVPIRNSNHTFRNLSSTPKQPTNANTTNYRSAIDSQILETTRVDQQLLERIENQIKNFQKRLTDEFMDQSKTCFDQFRKLGNQIMNTMQSNLETTNDQFKLLKISVDQVKDQIVECRSECKDVGEIKKQLAELKKEVNKLKKASSEQNIDESDLYNLDDDYGTNDSTSSFATQLSLQTAQAMNQFNQRLAPHFSVPPNPYQLYNQNLFNLYNQCVPFAQTPSIPGAPPLFDPTRTPVNYPGMFPGADQMYLDIAHLVPPTVPAAPTVPLVPTVPPVQAIPITSTVPTIPSKPVSVPSVTTTAATKSTARDTKEVPRSLPVNVVITASDPLPTCTTAPAPILSVTIPPKHIKGTPHSYQIQMPTASEAPPVFSFPDTTIKVTSVASPVTSWSTVFKSTPTTASGSPGNSLFSSSKFNESFDNSKTVVDGVFTSLPNTSLNKSRTLSERSNTSVENYDPCPDFKPIIPLPAEVKVTTGEENETVIFRSRAKLFRFVDKQWKERGIGEMKLLKHKVTEKVRVLMRREQIHKICANHIIAPEMEIKPMKNETKAYFWVANDFAEESVLLEKFCIRFKTAELAQQFYEKFEQARLESKTSSANVSKTEDSFIISTTTPKKETDQTSSKATVNTKPVSQQGKTQFGGFTFSSMPTFKATLDNNKEEIEPLQPATTTANIFGNLSFKPTNSSPFSNLFKTTNQTNSSPIETRQTPTRENKLNTSDVVEEFEPNVEFKPVVPLPALVDQKTGEEDEAVLFEHRAKLLRFDASSKEWKERGLGNIKLLVHKHNVQKLRLLMRREQIMKVCCNHVVTMDMSFQKMPNMDKAVTWCAKDFSEGELVTETFCLRFKTVQACDDFIHAVKAAQSKLKDESKIAKEEQNAAKQTGFGDKFRPKPGAWECQACYTNNLESFAKCACCEQPRPQSTIQAQISVPKASGCGDQFKPKSESWECKECLIRNEASIDYCSACNSPKDPNMPKKESNLLLNTPAKFSFGKPSQNQKPLSGTTVSGFGDKFKPQEGTWECTQCFVRNASGAEKCVACASSKDPNDSGKNENPTFVNITSGPKFTFGIPTSKTEDQQSQAPIASIFDGTGCHKFSFGIPSNAQENAPSVTSSIFGTPKVSAGHSVPVNPSFKINDEQNKPVKSVKPALLPTPQSKTDSGTFGSKDGGKFDFVFKPKTPPSKVKSPVKSPMSQKGDDSDGNEYASEDEGHHIHFNPVIPMPDKVDVVTGEENETELYGHRAKLFRFISGEWKERGIGIVKILKHNDTGKLRVVMRREQVLKICLNHGLTPEIAYSAKDDKTWLFAANDYSEGELSLQQFCLRFKTKEIALQFKDAVDSAKEGKPIVSKKTSESDDVVFVSETQATAEEKRKAKELMLPENFFTYKNKEPCLGCRGCKDEDEDTISQSSNSRNTLAGSKSSLSVSVTSASTPASFAFQSPTSSIYETPANFGNNSVFRTPLGSNTSCANFSPLSSTFTGTDTKDKENSFSQSCVLGELGQPSKTFNQPIFASKPVNLFGAGDNQTTPKGSLLAPPKLNTLNTSQEEKTPELRSIFGSTQTNTLFGESKPLFGNSNSTVSSNQSIFSTKPKDNSPKVEVKSIFGGDDHKPVSIFSGATQGSLFGPGLLRNIQQKSIFGTESVFGSSTPAAAPAPVSESGSSLFKAAASQPTWTFGSGAVKKTDVAPVKANEDKSSTEPTKKDLPFSVDNTLSFSALSTDGPGFSVQNKPDFKWEGAGQQLFTAGLKAAKDGNKSKNDSEAGEEGDASADEEYDPHYEPIVPLPEKIVVTTGEEDEDKLFGERSKLYRYDDKTREWKERGVGEMKILYHPERNTYRLLLRREQVHKAVLNMLIFMDLELLPMKNSDRAWTWAGRNFAETAAGEQETLAVRFKSVDLATAFHDKVVVCVRKLQAAAAQAIITSQSKHNTPPQSPGVAPLRLPKHLQDSARADAAMFFNAAGTTQAPPMSIADKQNGVSTSPAEGLKQVHFEEQPEEEVYDEYEHDYGHDEEYDDYYNEDEEESGAYYTCEGSASLKYNGMHVQCERAHVQVMFDQDVYTPKVMITDADTGEILSDNLIYTDTEFQLSGESCSWTATDYSGSEPAHKTVTVNFPDEDTAMQFYDSCETSKAATYSSTES